MAVLALMKKSFSSVIRERNFIAIVIALVYGMHVQFVSYVHVRFAHQLVQRRVSLTFHHSPSKIEIMVFDFASFSVTFWFVAVRSIIPVDFGLWSIDFVVSFMASQSVVPVAFVA